MSSREICLREYENLVLNQLFPFRLGCLFSHILFAELDNIKLVIVWAFLHVLLLALWFFLDLKIIYFKVMYFNGGTYCWKSAIKYKSAIRHIWWKSSCTKVRGWANQSYHQGWDIINVTDGGSIIMTVTIFLF